MGRKSDKNEAESLAVEGERVWPVGVRRLVSGILLFHLTAIVVGAASAHPSSLLERSLAEAFAPYFQAIDQGYAYRYYAPEPPPTPVVTATVRYPDGRPDATIRLPRRATFPWLLRQRELALANHLFNDFEAARFEAGDGSRSRWARAYARHIAKAYPGSASIALHSQLHLIPEIERVHEILEAPGSTGVDLDAEEFYTTPERIGDYPCDAF